MIIGLVIILLAMVAVWYFASPAHYPSIHLAELPPQQPSPTQLVNIAPRAEVNPESAKAVAATLSRPGSYVMNYTVTIYWESGEFSQDVELIVSGNSITVNGDEYTNPNGGSSESAMDAIAGIPTYEDILNPEVSIDEAEYTEAFGSMYLRVAYQGLLYKHVYYISLNSGLLEHARKYDGAKLVYAMDVSR